VPSSAEHNMEHLHAPSITSKAETLFSSPGAFSRNALWRELPSGVSDNCVGAMPDTEVLRNCFECIASQHEDRLVHPVCAKLAFYVHACGRSKDRKLICLDFLQA